MKNFLIIPNRQKDTGLALTSHIKDTLIGMGAECHIYDGYYNDVYDGRYYTDENGAGYYGTGYGTGGYYGNNDSAY